MQWLLNRGPWTYGPCFPKVTTLLSPLLPWKLSPKRANLKSKNKNKNYAPLSIHRPAALWPPTFKYIPLALLTSVLTFFTLNRVVFHPVQPACGRCIQASGANIRPINRRRFYRRYIRACRMSH